MQATKLVQWMDGKLRKSIFDHILGDIKISYAQVSGIEFHNVIYQLFHEDNLEDLFESTSEILDINKKSTEIMKLSLGLIENDVQHLPLSQIDCLNIAQASSNAMVYLINYLMELGFTIDDLLFNSPIVTEELVQRKMQKGNQPNNDFTLSGKIDLQIRVKHPEVIDWKYKTLDKPIKLYDSHMYQLDIYNFLLGAENMKRKIYFTTPEKVTEHEIAVNNYDLVKKSAIDFQNALDDISNPLGEATNHFETLWNEDYGHFVDEVSKLENSENLTVKRVYDLVNLTTMDSGLFTQKCDFCYQTCSFKALCVNFDR